MKITRTAFTLVAGALALAACAAPTAPPPPAAVPAEVVAPTAVATVAPAEGAVPAVQVVPLQTGTTFSVGDTIGVAVFCADSEGIASAGMTVDSMVVDQLTGTTETILQGTLTWTPDKPGQFNVGVIAYDNNRQVAEIQVREVTILPSGTQAPAPTLATTADAAATPMPAADTEGPAVSISDLASDWTDGSDVEVSVNAVDASGVVKLELYIDGEVVDTWEYDAAAGPAPQSAFATLTWPGAAEGDHTLYVMGTDAVGNTAQNAEQTVTVLP